MVDLTEGLSAHVLLITILLVIFVAGVPMWVASRSKNRAYDAWFAKQPLERREQMSRRAALLPNGDAAWREYVRTYRIEPLYAAQMQDAKELRWLLRYGAAKYHTFAVTQISEVSKSR